MKLASLCMRVCVCVLGGGMRVCVLSPTAWAAIGNIGLALSIHEGLLPTQFAVIGPYQWHSLEYISQTHRSNSSTPQRQGSLSISYPYAFECLTSDAETNLTIPHP